MMRLIVFGATGSVGKLIVQQGLDLGYQVTAFARNTSKINIEHPNLYLQQGDVLDVTSVERAMKGHDVVLCAVGAGRKGKVRSEGTRNIISAMERTGIQRLICQTTLGAGDSNKNLNFFWKYIMFGWFLKDAFLDHELQEKYITNSRLNWTIIRPAAFTDGEVTGSYKHGFFPEDKPLKLKVSRSDVAHFMLQQLASDLYVRKTPGLSY